MALISKIKRTYSRFKQISLESNKSILKIILDFYKCHRLYEISFFEYHNYEFEKKDLKYRESFLSFKKRRRLLLDNINPHNYAFIARNKFFSHLLLEELNIMTQWKCMEQISLI